MEEKTYGLIGQKLSHSWSPLIHKELGNPDYRLIELEPEELAEFFKNTAIGGVNVTIPYKRNVMALCDALSERARAIGSVNTVVRTENGLYGDNTDANGLLYMAKRVGIGFLGKKVLIFGSGGASLTVQHVAKEQGAREVVVVSRSGENNYQNLHLHADAEILINATPVGMFPNTGEAVADLSAFPRCEGVLDLVYNPRRTMLLQQAERLGIPRSDGLPMLVEQARAAEELFFGRTIPESENGRILGLIRRKTENIVLIGMPGCGKSTVGRILSNLTGREFIDVDEAIEQAAHMSIPKIFEKYGEGEFRRLEWEKTAEVGALSGKIIATGGGVVKDEKNYASLHQNGRIYHILRDVEKLSKTGRPLSQSANLFEMARERMPLYERFRDAAAENDLSAEETAMRIWRDFCENSGG